MSPVTRLLFALVIACAFPAVAAAIAQDDKAKDTAPAAPAVKVGGKTDAKPAEAPPEEAVVGFQKTIVIVNPGAVAVPAMRIMPARPIAGQVFLKQEAAKPAQAEVKQDAAKKDDAKADSGKDAAKGQVIEKRAVMKAVRIMPAQAAVAAKAGEPNLDPMIAQFVPQFLPLMRTEVHLLLSLTEATPEQRKAIVADRQKATLDAAKQYAQAQQRVGRFMNSNTQPEPRKIAQESLITVAKDHLPAEKIALYRAEIDRRAEDQKSLAIKNLVARMDADLVLSGDQREQLAASLAKNWNAAWCQSLETFMYGDQYFPSIPDTVVTPTLNPKQIQVWRTTPKNGGVIFGGFNQVFGGMEVADVFPKDEEPEEKDKEKVGAPNALMENVRIVRQVIVDGAQAVEIEKVEAKPAEKKTEKKDDAKDPKKEAKKDEVKDTKKDEAKETKGDTPAKDAPKDTPKA